MAVKPRVIETNEGIQGEFNVFTYDKMQRRLRDKGWIETDAIIKFGISAGLALEVGPGPGYLGLEWLKKTSNTTLKCVEISPDMISIAGTNAVTYGLAGRVEYKPGKAEDIPFADATFAAVFTNGSLHEWPEPARAFNEIHRVLKPGGRFFISDLKRNINPVIVWLLEINTQPKEIRPGLITSINAAYTKQEIQGILQSTCLKNARVTENFIGIEIKGEKV
jgi:ubiquinone/menaquinone biosynthesis C-methylase UbiE